MLGKLFCVLLFSATSTISCKPSSEPTTQKPSRSHPSNNNNPDEQEQSGNKPVNSAQGVEGVDLPNCSKLPVVNTEQCDCDLSMTNDELERLAGKKVRMASSLRFSVMGRQSIRQSAKSNMPQDFLAPKCACLVTGKGEPIRAYIYFKADKFDDLNFYIHEKNIGGLGKSLDIVDFAANDEYRSNKQKQEQAESTKIIGGTTFKGSDIFFHKGIAKFEGTSTSGSINLSFATQNTTDGLLRSEAGLYFSGCVSFPSL